MIIIIMSIFSHCPIASLPTRLFKGIQSMIFGRTKSRETQVNVSGIKTVKLLLK